MATVLALLKPLKSLVMVNNTSQICFLAKGVINMVKQKKPSNDDIDEKVKQFDRKVIGDYLIPFVVSLVTTLLTLAALYAR